MCCFQRTTDEIDTYLFSRNNESRKSLSKIAAVKVMKGNPTKLELGILQKCSSNIKTFYDQDNLKELTICTPSLGQISLGRRKMKAWKWIKK